MPFKFSKNSLKKLSGVHPDLVRVAKRALELSYIDFGIVSGVRTFKEQVALFAQGRKPLVEVNRLRMAAGMHPLSPSENKSPVTWTMNSNHLPKSDGYGYAIDIGVFINGKYVANDTKPYIEVSKFFKKAADELDVFIGYGGDWIKNKDYPHFELLET